MEESRRTIEIFKDKVEDLYALFDQLDDGDRACAVQNVSDFVERCNRTSLSRSSGGEGGTDDPVVGRWRPTRNEDDNDVCRHLRREIDRLKRENEKLKGDLEQLHRRITSEEQSDPHSVVTAILDELISRVALRRSSRSRAGAAKKAATTPVAPAPGPEAGGKRKRGRPRKYPRPEDVVDATPRQTNSTVEPPGPPVPLPAAAPIEEPVPSVPKHEAVNSTGGEEKEEARGEPPVKAARLSGEVREEERAVEEAQPEKLSLRLRSRRAASWVNKSQIDSDDDGCIDDNDFLPDSSGDEGYRERDTARSTSKKSRTGRPSGRPRGRPRKHPPRDPSTIKRHKRIVRHVCQLCNAQFLHGRPFHRHLSVRHASGGTSCLRCRKEFENYAHYLHHRCESKRGHVEHQCKRCDMTFGGLGKLKEHVHEVHGQKKVDPLYFCKFCHKGFIRKSSLVHHLRTHADDGQLVCDKCGEFSATKEEQEAHMAKHQRPTTGSLHCDLCGAVFDRRQQFDLHMAAHDRYGCSICSKPFSRKKLLVKHVREVHDIKVPMEDKRHTCSDCGRSFHRPGQLQIHRRVHTGERPIECGTCRMFFKSNKALWKHRQTHTHMVREGAIPVEKNHLCAICGKAYFRKQALQRHMRYHDESKPYPCPHCQYRCRDLNNLKRHISLHFSQRQFVCEICGASFHAKKTLETHHVYKHSSDRQYKCKDCPMTFKTPNSLRRHQVIHSAVRPYKCPSCSMGFNRLYNLRRHMIVVHGSDEGLPPVNRVRVLDGTSNEKAGKKSESGAGARLPPAPAPPAPPQPPPPPPPAAVEQLTPASQSLEVQLTASSQRKPAQSKADAISQEIFFTHDKYGMTPALTKKAVEPGSTLPQPAHSLQPPPPPSQQQGVAVHATEAAAEAFQGRTSLSTMTPTVPQVLGHQPPHPHMYLQAYPTVTAVGNVTGAPPPSSGQAISLTTVNPLHLASFMGQGERGGYAHQPDQQQQLPPAQQTQRAASGHASASSPHLPPQDHTAPASHPAHGTHPPADDPAGDPTTRVSYPAEMYANILHLMNNAS